MIWNLEKPCKLRSDIESAKDLHGYGILSSLVHFLDVVKWVWDLRFNQVYFVTNLQVSSPCCTDTSAGQPRWYSPGCEDFHRLPLEKEDRKKVCLHSAHWRVWYTPKQIHNSHDFVNVETASITLDWTYFHIYNVWSFIVLDIRRRCFVVPMQQQTYL